MASCWPKRAGATVALEGSAMKVFTTRRLRRLYDRRGRLPSWAPVDYKRVVFPVPERCTRNRENGFFSWWNGICGRCTGCIPDDWWDNDIF
jgi:hypothetical protein